MLGIHYLKEIYSKEKPDFSERSTVPIIVDEKSGKGVNNDHFWIPIYLETAWKQFHKESAPELYSENLRKDIDDFNWFILATKSLFFPESMLWHLLYQGKQIGRRIIDFILKQVKDCTVILYTHPKTIALYEKIGFRRQKTGMVILNKPEDQEAWMEEEGFILPRNYRFGDNQYEQL